MFDEKEVQKIDLEKLLYADNFWLDEHFENKKKSDKRKILERGIDSFLKSTINIPVSSKSDYLFFRSLERNDYENFFHEVAGCTEHSKLIVENYWTSTQELDVEKSHILSSNFGLMSQIDSECSIRRAYLYIKLCSYLTVLELIKQLDFKYLILFADMQPVENLLASYYKGTEVITVTLQHGLYVEYSAYKTVNVINYLHHDSDYFLAWGNNTKDLIEKYNHTANVQVCGKPRVFLANQEESVTEPEDYVLVVLDQRIFDSYNIEMLEIVYKFYKNKNTQVRVKPHPSNNLTLYKQQFPNMVISSNIESASMIIGHTTSVIYEALALGINVMRYRTEIPAINLPEELEFNDLSDYKHVATNIDKIKKVSSEFIDSLGENSLAKYRAFFQSLESN